ncbi:MAG TPA: GNAT family N-acetyltransferase [Pyrinomonadaceae bacterium]
MIENLKSDGIVIRDLLKGDCEMIADAFSRQGWDKPASKFRQYLAESKSGARRTLIAELRGAFAGYLNIVWNSEYPLFSEREIPEITDLNVLIDHRRHGIATALLGEAEGLIAKRSGIAGIRVGVDADYGPAQQLYVLRGYVPDGRGLTSCAKQVKYGEQITVDDDLTIGLMKRLR